MPQTVITLSQMNRYNRMDDKFHIAVVENQSEITKAEKAWPEKAFLIDKLMDVSLTVIQDTLVPLRRGRAAGKINEREKETLINAYPYVALALVNRVLHDHIILKENEEQGVRSEIEALTVLENELRLEDVEC